MRYPGEYGALIADQFVRGGGWRSDPDLAWQNFAACAQPSSKPVAVVSREADRYFPGGGRPSAAKKSVCGRCPVRQQCLDYALVHQEQGTWGGLTEKERSKLLAITKEQS